MNLSPHFTLEELIASQTAMRLGINNRPGYEAQRNLAWLCQTLEGVRALLGQPVVISSGFRCARLNAVMGGAANSAHMEGLAADFAAPEYGSPLQVAQAIADAGILFDQLICEGAWVHLAISLDHNRREILTASFQRGKARYTAGLSAPHNTTA